jgi:hypothetical protein
MARIIHFLAAGALLMAASGSFGQSGAAKDSGSARAQNQSDQATSLAAGTTVNAELSHSLDSKKAKPGDVVTAQTTEEVKTDGKVVIPRNTKLVGHVTRASARSKGDSQSLLAVQFDRAVLKDGHELPLQVGVQAIAAERGPATVSGDDLQPGNIEGGAAGAGAAGHRGTVGGVGNTVGGAASGAASTVPRTIDQSGTLNSTTGAATGASGQIEGGLNSSGELKSTSRGVYGLSGLALNANAANSTEGAVIISAGKNVHLDSGTRLLLAAQARPSVAAQR